MSVTCTPIRAAQYLRMSTELQQYSTANQKAAIGAWASARDIEIIATYEDVARSGLTLAGRPALRRLIADVVGGRPGFDAILVYDVSRWGRFQDADESAHLEFLCRAAGVAVHYCAEPFSNDGTPLASFCKLMKRALAAEYSRELSDKVFAGKARLALLGFRQGSRPGYGLRRRLLDLTGRDKGKLATGEQKRLTTDRVVLTPGPKKEVAIVRWMYEAYAERGLSMNAIRDELNARGVMYEGRPWSRGAVLRVLTSPKYVGDNVWSMSSGKLSKPRRRKPQEAWIRCEHAFEPLVPRALFERVRERREQRAAVISDEELLDRMRRVWRRKGRVTCRLLRESGLVPSVFDRRFGSMAKAYELCGIEPASRPRDVARLRARRAQRRKVRDELCSIVEAAGGTFEWKERRGEALINEELRLLVSSAGLEIKNGREVWGIRRGALDHDVIILTLLDRDFSCHDHFVLPPGEAKSSFKFREHNEPALELFRVTSLAVIAAVTRRVPLSIAALRTVDGTYEDDPYDIGRPPALIVPRIRCWKRGRGRNRARPQALLNDIAAFFQRKRLLIEKAAASRALAKRLAIAIRAILHTSGVVASLRTAGLVSAPAALFGAPALFESDGNRSAGSMPNSIVGRRGNNGLCGETARLLAGQKLQPKTIRCLADMKDQRQIEAAREMLAEHRCSYEMARVLLATTLSDQLATPHFRHVIAGRRGVYEAVAREASKIDRAHHAALALYPADAFALSTLAPFARRIVELARFAPARRLAGARRMAELKGVLADVATRRDTKRTALFGRGRASPRTRRA